MSRNDATRKWRAGTRRRFLTALGATGVAIGVGGVTAAQDDDGEDDDDGPAETFVLGGEVEAWRGVAPDDIADEDNPTLELEVDQEYVIVWENLDGEPHNVALLDENEEPIQALEEIDVPEDVPVPSEELEDGDEEDGTPTPTPGDEETPTPTPEDEDGTPTPTPEDEGTPELVDVSETIDEEGAMQAVRFTATEEMVQYFCSVHPTTMIGDVSPGDGDDGDGDDGTPTPEDDE